MPGPLRTFRTRLSRKWKLALAAVVAAAAVAVPVGFANADSDASAKPAFKMPFTCGKTFYANNWSPGHNPANSIDWQSYGNDAVNKESVKASAAGTVKSVIDKGNQSYGKYVVVSHGSGWETLYAHLSKFSVKVGQKVTTSTEIGKVGETGGAKGPHLHFEEKHNGAVQSPVIDGTSVPLGSKKALTSKNCGGGGNDNPYTAEEICGSGYSTIDSQALKVDGKKVGTVVLTYNSSSKKNCVATLKAVNLNKKTATSAFLEVKGGKRATDSGKFAYYAGPVTKAAGKTCVQWGGSVGDGKYTSKFEHCG